MGREGEQHSDRLQAGHFFLVFLSSSLGLFRAWCYDTIDIWYYITLELYITFSAYFEVLRIIVPKRQLIELIFSVAVILVVVCCFTVFKYNDKIGQDARKTGFVSLQLTSDAFVECSYCGTSKHTSSSRGCVMARLFIDNVASPYVNLYCVLAAPLRVVSFRIWPLLFLLGLVVIFCFAFLAAATLR